MILSQSGIQQFDSYAEAIAHANLAGRRRLAGAAADAWRPRVRVQASQWAADNVYLSAMFESRPGRLDFTERPWWREVIDAFLDPEVREINVPAATQLGKTVTLIAAVLTVAVTAPAPGMVVLPDKDAAIEFRDRLYYTALASPSLRAAVPPSHLWNSRYVDLGRMRVYLAWSGSRQRLRGRPCRYVWLSEVDVYASGDDKAGNPIAAAEQRVKAFYRSCQYRESSPSPDPSSICTKEAACDDRRRWVVECPHCGLSQQLRFFTNQRGPQGKGGIGGLYDEAGQLRSAAEAARHAHYVCEQGCRIESEHKRNMLLGGRWISLGQSVDKAGRVRGPKPKSRRKLGYHLWSIFSDTVRFSDLAAAYVEAKENEKLPEFYGNWLGLSYAPKSKMPEWSVVGRRSASDYKRGSIPKSVWFLTGGGDVQNDRVYWSVRGWEPGAKSHLIDWGEYRRESGDEGEIVKTDLAKLNKVLKHRWPIVGGVNPLGYSELPVRLMNIDSNHRTLDVHNWLRSLPEDWTENTGREIVRAVRGDHTVDRADRWRANVVEKSSRDGTVYEGGLVQWGLFVYPFYQELFERIASGQGWFLPSTIARVGKKYLQQVTNFTYGEMKRAGRSVMGWRPKSKAIGNDYWDTEIYALVAAYMLLDQLSWNEEDWRQYWAQQEYARGTAPRITTADVGMIDAR